MKLLRNMVAANATNCESSIVRHDDKDDDVFYSHRRRDSPASFSSSLSLYGRRPSLPPPSLVTSTKFDNDEDFARVARTLLCKYEHDKTTETEAFNATLQSTDDKCAFIQAMDSKYVALTGGVHFASNDESVDDSISEIIFRTRSVFYHTFTSVWKEIMSSRIQNEESIGDYYMQNAEHNDTQDIENDVIFDLRPNAPKNIQLSPMRSSNDIFDDEAMDDASELEGTNKTECCVSDQQPLKRQRRWFFAESEVAVTKYKIVMPSFSAQEVTRKPLKIGHQPFLKFNFGLGDSNIERNRSSSYLPQTLGQTSFAQQTLGLGQEYPLSPVRKVSIEMLGELK